MWVSTSAILVPELGKSKQLVLSGSGEDASGIGLVLITHITCTHEGKGNIARKRDHITYNLFLFYHRKCF